MTEAELLDCINFFDRLNVIVTDITTSEELNNNQKVVKVKYSFEGNKYQTKPLYYKEISGLTNVRNINHLHNYFGNKVYWLDIEKHEWPKPSGESDLNNLVINDVALETDHEFRSLLLRLANNAQTGYIQRITRDGRSGQYYHNLENNNHWHDLILFIKQAIICKGQAIPKQYFEHLIFNWDKGLRTSLNAAHQYKIVTDFYNNLKSIQPKMNLNDIKSLLQYKKQIILQGPPGTGKTKLAKELAEDLIRSISITKREIQNIVKIGDAIISLYDKIPYIVDSINENGISLKLENGSLQSRNFDNIIQAYSDMIQGKPIAQGETYQRAIAKYVSDNLNKHNQYKIIQFHSSYSYEDFVRGISANATSTGISYENENRILSKMAKEAQENWILSSGDAQVISKDISVDNAIFSFLEYLNDELDANSKITLTESIYINSILSNSIRYASGNSGYEGSIPISDIKKMFLANIATRQEVKKLDTLSRTARGSASSYWFKILSRFKNYIQEKNLRFDVAVAPETTKNYVLIIDEINRANLSSVLGELIYGLEYRNEAVTGIYEVDGSYDIILPPNFYVIGTMNTADRSVGSIDYAIRRRFAFANVYAKDLSGELGNKFAKSLFDKVSLLFDSHLSSEFQKSDVQLGHSYFIDKTETGGSLNIRLEYEIKPILLEYVRDGILVGEDIKQAIETLTI